MNKIIKVVRSLGILTVVIFGVYAYKLHSLAVEGNKIFAFRCTNVNPPLIAYKKSYLKFADAINNQDKYTIDEGKGFYSDYISGMGAYVEQENKWLEMNRVYLDRWDFNLIEPWYIKEAGGYQYKWYEGLRDGDRYLVQIAEGKNYGDDYVSIIDEAANRRDKYEKLYFDLFDRASNFKDWRKIFGYVPVPKECTKENLIIPDTYDAINWGGTPTPTPLPVKPISSS